MLRRVKPRSTASIAYGIYGFFPQRSLSPQAFDYCKLLIRFMPSINALMLPHTNCDDSVLSGMGMGQSTLLAKVRCMGGLSVAQAWQTVPNWAAYSRVGLRFFKLQKSRL